MSGPAPIVCGVDDSIAARAAARLSAALARRLGLPLVLVHAASTRWDHDVARFALAELRSRLDAPDVTLHVDVGPAFDVLLEAADHATLLALGGPSASARCSVLGGRVRAALARRAPCPQVVVPAVLRLGGAEVVCGVRDWADVATAEVAALLARALGLQLTLIHVLSAAGSGWRAPGPDVGLLARPWDDDAGHRLLDAVATAVGAAPATHVAYGPAGQTLGHEAAERDAAMLVIGAPRYGVVGSTLTGSASTHLLRRTPRPLLVCPEPQRASDDAPLWPPVSAGSASGSW